MKTDKAKKAYGSYYSIPRGVLNLNVCSVPVLECLGNSDKKSDHTSFFFKSEEDIEKYISYHQYVSRLEALHQKISTEVLDKLDPFHFFSKEHKIAKGKFSKAVLIIQHSLDKMRVNPKGDSMEAHRAVERGTEIIQRFERKTKMKKVIHGLCEHYKIDFPTLSENNGFSLNVTNLPDDIDVPEQRDLKDVFFVCAEGTENQALEWKVLRGELSFSSVFLDKGSRVVKENIDSKGVYHSSYSFFLEEEKAKRSFFDREPNNLPNSLTDEGHKDLFCADKTPWLAFKSAASALKYIEEQQLASNNNYAQISKQLSDHNLKN
jgi:hypothetical protein